MIELREISSNEEEIVPLEEATPISTPAGKRRPSMRKLLVHQMSSLELPVDPKSGMVKLHYWY